MSLHRNMYKMAKNDSEFMQEMRKGKANTPPGFFASEIEIGCWATAYYGYLVGKNGVYAADHMKEKAKLM